MEKIFLLLLITLICLCRNVFAIETELKIGFKATLDPSASLFQALLTDPTQTFSFGFLRVKQTQLALAVVHVASSEPLWLANPTRLAKWSKSVKFFFNGSIVFTDTRTGVFWSSDSNGDSVKILKTSNLVVEKSGETTNSSSVIWESFDSPGNTLVENQNFTSAMSLVSSNGLYYMRLGDDFMGLYAKFGDDSSDQMYLKQRALQAKAEIAIGKGPIYARISPDGYLGMYQLNDSLPVDVQAFNSFNRPINGFNIIRIELDGNLKAYYWDGTNWVLDYMTIRTQCELPSPCGPYGLCKPGAGCSCLNNQTIGVCSPPEYSGDFCREGIAQNRFSVLRRTGVELPFKELMEYEKMSSSQHCEDSCEKNCSCWGSVYNNASGFCYMVNYPIQTLLSVGDETKVGYFKVRRGAGSKVDAGFRIGIGLICGVMLLIVSVIAFIVIKVCRRRRGGGRGHKLSLAEENGMSPGPYKDLASASFRSIELGNR